MEHLYFMLSRTGTGMGKVIRAFTRNEYNHVSLTLDPSFERFVSFARYRQDVVLAGGLVVETTQRFLCTGQPVPVRIYRVEIPPEQYIMLKNLFDTVDEHRDLIYNSLGALLSTWSIPCHVPGAYTCLEFAAAILNQPLRTLQELQSFLMPYEIFAGDLGELVQDNSDRSELFFNRRGFWGGTVDTVRHFTRLAGRLLRISRYNDPIAIHE